MERRNFLKSGALITGGLAFPFIAKGRNHGMAASDQVNIGLIGCRNRGYHVLRNHLKVPGVNCIAICDIDANVLGERADTLQKEHGQDPALFEDYRKMLELSDLDAVIIGTPDHWHCLQMIHACQAGKDVYVEKPMANSIEECNRMLAAAERYDRVVEVGQQQRSSEVWQQVMDYVRSGVLGKISKVDIWGNFNYGLGPNATADTPIPAGVNFDLFLGPAPERPFNKARYHGSWRFFWDYGGGLMTDWGVHLLDMALWAKKITTPPKSVVAVGHQLPLQDRMRETPDVLSATFEYDDYLIQWEHFAGKQTGPYDRNYGVAFMGEHGTIVADRSKYEVFPEYDPKTKTGKVEKIGPIQGNNGHSKHPEDFVDCIKSRKSPACTVAEGRAVAIAAHMANIAVRSGVHHLTWDETKHRFDQSRANKLLEPKYRAPWKLPKI